MSASALPSAVITDRISDDLSSHRIDHLGHLSHALPDGDQRADHRSRACCYGLSPCGAPGGRLGGMAIAVRSTGLAAVAVGLVAADSDESEHKRGEWRHSRENVTDQRNKQSDHSDDAKDERIVADIGTVAWHLRVLGGMN